MGNDSSKKEGCVFKTLNGTDPNLLIIKDHIVEEVEKLKKAPGKDLWLYGGSSLITSFMNLGLIDEYRLSVHPVVLGTGRPLFVDIKQDKRLNWFSSGVVQLCYHTAE